MTRTVLSAVPRWILPIVLAAPLHALTFRTSEEVIGRLTEFQFVSHDGKTLAGTTLYAGRAAAFRFSESDGFQILAGLLPPATEGVWTSGMSDDGTVVFGHVQHGDYPKTVLEGFVWNQGSGFQRTGLLGGSNYSVCRAISPDAGTIFGQAELNGVVSCFLWTPGNGIESFADRFSDFPAKATEPVYLSNDARTVWANAWEDRGPSVIFWNQGHPPIQYTDLDGGHQILTVRAVTPDGALAFGSGNTDAGYSAVHFKPDGSLELLFPGQPFQSQAMDVTSDGRLVVAHVDGQLDPSSMTATDSAFLDRQTGRVTFLSQIISENLPAAATWSSIYAIAISGDGDTVIGSGIDSIGNLNSWVLDGMRDYLLPPAEPLAVWAKKRLTLNRQTGLVEQVVTVKNKTSREISGFDLVVTDLPSQVRLHDSSIHKGSTWKLKHRQPLAGGASVNLLLKYHSASRRTGFHPKVRLDLTGQPLK